MQQNYIDFIVLAGYLKMIPAALVDAFPQAIINIHPALLPDFGGMGMHGEKVHAAVLASGQAKSGITIHFVNEAYDEGKIIFQANCPVMPGDTVESLSKRVLQLEHAHYAPTIETIVSQRDF